MDNRLPSGLRFLLGLSGRRLLAAQWLGIGTLALLGGGWMLQDEWRQRESATERQQRLRQQIAVAQRQLDEAPVALMPPTPLAPATTGDLTNGLQRAGGALLRWQRQEKPPRQTLSLRIDYPGLLALLEALPADLRLEQLSVETPPQGMTARLVLQDAAEELADE
jgi:hypothetical protein